MIRHRFSHPTRSLLSLVAVLFLSLGSLSVSPVAAQPTNLSVDVTGLTCEGLIIYTYTSDQPVEIGFQFYQTPPDVGYIVDRYLIGGATVQLQPGVDQTGSVQGRLDNVDISEAPDPYVVAYYFGEDDADDTQELDRLDFPDDCGGGTEPPPTDSEPSETQQFIAQLVALLIAIMVSLLG